MLTSASITSTYIHHSLTYYDNGGKSLFLVLKTMVYMFDRAFGQFIENTGAPYVVVPIVGIAVYFFAKQFGGFWSQLKNRNLSPLWFISLGLVAQMFVSASVRWVFRDWYFIPTLFVVQFIVLFALIQLSKEFKNFKYVIGIFMIMSAGFFYISYEKNLKDREILQDTMWKAALWQNERVPVGSKIGAFNSGIQGYFSIHTVVNLDGLVNNVASAYMLKHDMWKYITGVENLDYVSDFPKYINYKFDRFFGVGIQSVHILPQLELIHTIMGGPQDLNVYKVLYK